MRARIAAAAASCCLNLVKSSLSLGAWLAIRMPACLPAKEPSSNASLCVVCKWLKLVSLADWRAAFSSGDNYAWLASIFPIC